jgi:triphosphatase
VRKPLKPIFGTRVERTAYHLNGNGADIVMAIDEGQILANGSSRPVSEIELDVEPQDVIPGQAESADGRF